MYVIELLLTVLGVFSKEDKQFGDVWKGAIKYRVKAEVDIPGTKHDLQVCDMIRTNLVKFADVELQECMIYFN